jgi:hypothetical protein
MIRLPHLLVLSIIVLYSSCSNSTKVIDDKEIANSEIRERIFNKQSAQMHNVTVLELLEGGNYDYMYVSEDTLSYWLATKKGEYVIGKEYVYSSFIPKTDFSSKEFNRVFEQLNLVSNLIPASSLNTKGHVHGPNCNHGNLDNQDTGADYPFDENSESISVTIAELVENPTKYISSWVLLSGICVKVNTAILDRNWIHIKDGTLDSYDLVITSNDNVKLGDSVTFKARITLNKDFGAGYSYPLLLEQGTLVN